MAGPPDTSRFQTLVRAISVDGPQRFIYSYVREDGSDAVFEFLERLRQSESGRHTNYMTTFRRVGLEGKARDTLWHMLDPDKPPKGIAKDGTGVPFSLKSMGEFKNVSHQSRIFHCTEPNGIFVLLTVFEGKKESDLKAEMVNPALVAREEYFRRKNMLLAKKGGG